MTFSNLDKSYGPNCAKPISYNPNLYIVPGDKSYGYESLTHQLPQVASGYFPIIGAYPKPCTTFGYRSCTENQIKTSLPFPK